MRWLLIACLLLAVSADAVADTTTITGSTYTDDADIQYYSQATNTGSETVCFTGNYASDSRYAIMVFDLSGGGVSGTIDTAILTINMVDNVASIVWYCAELITPFDEATCTYNFADSSSGYTYWAGGGDFTFGDGTDYNLCSSAPCDTTGASTATYNQSLTFDGSGLKNIMQNIVNGTAYGLLLYTSDSTAARRVNSSENATPEYRPSLYIEYTTGSGATGAQIF